MFKKFISVILTLTVICGFNIVSYAIMPGWVSSVTISGDDELTIYVGDEITLEATAIPEGFSYAYMVWYTDDADVINIDGDKGTTEFDPPKSSANVKALTEGTAVITVYADINSNPYPDEYTAHASVTINVINQNQESVLNNQCIHSGIYDLDGKRQCIADAIISEVTIKGAADKLVQHDDIPGQIDVSEQVLSNANEGEMFLLTDIRTDNEENPYPNIEETNVTVSFPQSAGEVGQRLGKDYRLFFTDNENGQLTDITDKIVNGNNITVTFKAEKLGTYVLYFNPAVYEVVFYLENPIYDDNGNLTNPECIYKEVADLKSDSIMNFPPIPEKAGYVFTGWKSWIGSGIYYTLPQPLYAADNSEYYASWCLEDEYEPIKIEISSDSITKGKEDGQKITLKTDYGVFVSDEAFPSEWRSAYEAETDEEIKSEILAEWKSQWNITGCDDILIESAQRIDDKTVEFTLSGNSSNIYSDSEIYIEFNSSLLLPETYEENGNLIDWNDTKIQMDSDGVRQQMYRSDNSVTLNKQNRPSSGGGGGGSSTASYTVKFEANGGSEVKSQSIKRNSVLSKPENPVKEGFEFAGWFKDKNLTEKYDFTAKVTTGFTLYAAWNEIDISKQQIILTIGKKSATVFGETKVNDVEPIIVNDRTMLPARFVAENLGADVEWDETAQGIVTITKDDVEIIIYIGEEYSLVNGEKVKLDAPAFIENDRTYTPIRFISERLGADVRWNEETQSAIITLK